MYTKQEIIIRSYRDGESVSEIARKVQVCRKTVRKYVRDYSAKKKELEEINNFENQPGGMPLPFLFPKGQELTEAIITPPTYNSSNREKRKITKMMVKAVEECLTENCKKRSSGRHKQQMKKMDIFEFLREKGFVIGYTSICKLVNELEDKHSETFIKQKYKPGDVCEFDWGQVKVYIKGKLRTYPMAVFTPAYSNYRYAVLFPKQNMQCFQEAHALFFEYIGGVYRTMVYDNMKVAVRKFIGRTEKEATEGLLKLSLYYNFAFRFCNVRAGNEKGHVERSVEYVRRKAFSPKDEFELLSEGNEHLLLTCDNLNKKPQKGNQNRSAIELLKIEREYLLPVLPKFECARLSDLRVDKYSTVTVDNCHYSVPEKYTGKIITTKIYSSELICYDDNKRVCTHKKLHSAGEWKINIAHYLKSLKRKPGAIMGSIAFSQMDAELQSLYKKYFQSKPKDFVNLLIYMKENDKSLQEIQKVISKLETVCPLDISTDKIKIICERKDEETHWVVSESMIEETSLKQLSALARLVPHKDNLNKCGGVL